MGWNAQKLRSSTVIQIGATEDNQVTEEVLEVPGEAQEPDDQREAERDAEQRQRRGGSRREPEAGPGAHGTSS